jgi:hypothetical protein
MFREAEHKNNGEDMQNYPQRVRDNILPLSIGNTLPEAFEEWSFTDRTVDHEDATETCQLCEHEELRYHFQIENALTHHTLWVGSQCILKFGLSVFEEGQTLSPKEAQRKLDRLTQQMRLQSCIKALEKLAAAENNKILNSALDYYQRNKFLTPRYAFVVLWRLQEHGIEHSPTFFKIHLNKQRYKSDLQKMEASRVHLIWPALSSSQRTLAMRLGHTPPLS